MSKNSFERKDKKLQRTRTRPNKLLQYRECGNSPTDTTHIAFENSPVQIEKVLIY